MINGTYHMGLSVDGALANYPTDRAFIKAFEGSVKDDAGRPVHPLLFREELRKLQAQGVKMIPMGDCDAFDPQTGCPGHPFPDEQAAEANVG